MVILRIQVTLVISTRPSKNLMKINQRKIKGSAFAKTSMKLLIPSIKKTSKK